MSPQKELLARKSNSIYNNNHNYNRLALSQNNDSQTSEVKPVDSHAVKRIIANPASLTPSDVKNLAPVVGNQAIQRLISGRKVSQHHQTASSKSAATKLQRTTDNLEQNNLASVRNFWQQKDKNKPGILPQNKSNSIKSVKEAAKERIQQNRRYYLRFAHELRKMVKRDIPEGEMLLIWRRFSDLMKQNEAFLPKWGETDWGKDPARARVVDTTDIQLTKLATFRKGVQFLTEIVEKGQSAKQQVDNATLWSNINVGRPAANDKQLNEALGVKNGGTPLNETSMGALLDLFAVGALEHEQNKDFKNINSDLLLNDNQPYMQWGASFNVWAALSADFAAKATGEVHVYVPTGTGTGSVFWTAELPELRKNKQVTGIFIHQLSDFGKYSVADEKAKKIEQIELQARLKTPQAWTTSTISGLTVTGAGGAKGISAGKLKNMGLKWKKNAQNSDI